MCSCRVLTSNDTLWRIISEGSEPFENIVSDLMKLCIGSFHYVQLGVESFVRTICSGLVSTYIMREL